jgi:transposase InsO family protein
VAPAGALAGTGPVHRPMEPVVPMPCGCGTKLLGPDKVGLLLPIVIVDIFSRYAPGWMLARSDNASLAEALLAETAIKQGVEFGQWPSTLIEDRR